MHSPRPPRLRRPAFQESFGFNTRNPNQTPPVNHLAFRFRLSAFRSIKRSPEFQRRQICLRLKQLAKRLRMLKPQRVSHFTHRQPRSREFLLRFFDQLIMDVLLRILSRERSKIASRINSLSYKSDTHNCKSPIPRFRDCRTHTDSINLFNNISWWVANPKMKLSLLSNDIRMISICSLLNQSFTRANT